MCFVWSGSFPDPWHCRSIQAEPQNPEPARPDVPPSPPPPKSPHPLALPVPAHHGSSTLLGAWRGRSSRWWKKQWRQAARSPAHERRLHVRPPPHPSCLLPEGSSEHRPSSAFTSKSSSSLVFLCTSLQFFEERKKISPR